MADSALARLAEGQYLVADLRSHLAEARRLVRLHGPSHENIAVGLDEIADGREGAADYADDASALAVELADVVHELALLRALVDDAQRSDEITRASA